MVANHPTIGGGADTDDHISFQSSPEHCTQDIIPCIKYTYNMMIIGMLGRQIDNG